jgi:integral membrane protein (TIGR01906 family)
MIRMEIANSESNITIAQIAGNRYTILTTLLSLAIPLLLIILNVRLVMSPLFLQIEYTRAGFPSDPFGLTTEDRLRYAPSALDYLIYNQSISALGDLTFANGRPLFNARELQHMVDVQIVTQWAFGVGIVVGALTAAAGVALWRRDRARLRVALNVGAKLTLGLIAAVVIFALLGWEMFFTGFHTMFFADGTWYFLTSDTLIRLFPEQFWFDAALAIGGLAALEAGVILLFSVLSSRFSVPNANRI